MSKKNFDILVTFFKQENWQHSQQDNEPILHMGYEGNNGRWSCYAKVRELEQQCAFYSICPVTVPNNRYLAMAEFLTRANYGLIVGNFEMNMDDGKIYYKTSLDFEGDNLSLMLIKQLVYSNVEIMDTYLRGIEVVASSEILPREAIAKLEAVA
ncbi:MAG: YbjN domain-containing protein [Nostoc sp. NMS7]|uniref:YbjN domain-containing protein n=1 Tax=Nostoc sp. NMS7 TaxID=2815391 RepID=UPI0025FDB442|nr:YbjN domain-containing protein [Nostoc sp. NMS7]MBN3947887.1 YbjN domain-containing protein [Nostoc sp. NMS7]